MDDFSCKIRRQAKVNSHRPSRKITAWPSIEGEFKAAEGLFNHRKENGKKIGLQPQVLGIDWRVNCFQRIGILFSGFAAIRRSLEIQIKTPSNVFQDLNELEIDS